MSVKFLLLTELLCLIWVQKISKKPPKPNQKNILERETRKILNDFSSRPHVCDNECFLLYAPVCSGRSSTIWVTNSSNLFGAEACETATWHTQWSNTVWTLCHVLVRKEQSRRDQQTSDLFCSSPASCQPAARGLLESHFSLCKEATNHGTYLPSVADEEGLYEI